MHTLSSRKHTHTHGSSQIFDSSLCTYFCSRFFLVVGCVCVLGQASDERARGRVRGPLQESIAHPARAAAPRRSHPPAGIVVGISPPACRVRGAYAARAGSSGAQGGHGVPRRHPASPRLRSGKPRCTHAVFWWHLRLWALPDCNISLVSLSPLAPYTHGKPFLLPVCLLLVLYGPRPTVRWH